METVRWPYEMCELLEAVNNEELPVLYMKLFVMYAPNAFYSSCIIMEVRDYRQSFPQSACCDNYYVLLKPTTQTLLADAKFLSSSAEFSNDDRLQLECNMVMAASEPLCLDPSPKVARKALYNHYKRQMWNSFSIRRQMRKFTQTAINRKRKLDQFTATYGFELTEYLTRSRIQQRERQILKQREKERNGGVSPKSEKIEGPRLPRNPNDVIKPIVSPISELPTTLVEPSSVDTEDFATYYERPRDTRDCTPNLIEEYILETDRGGGRVYHIKLSIYQRPANSEYLGELYVDRDYEQNTRNGEACQFALGTRAHANRYIQQFTEIFTEEGRKSVKITHIVPGQKPVVSYTTGLNEYCQIQPPVAPPPPVVVKPIPIVGASTHLSVQDVAKKLLQDRPKMKEQKMMLHYQPMQQEPGPPEKGTGKDVQKQVPPQQTPQQQMHLLQTPQQLAQQKQAQQQLAMHQQAQLHLAQQKLALQQLAQHQLASQQLAQQQQEDDDDEDSYLLYLNVPPELAILNANKKKKTAIQRAIAKATHHKISIQRKVNENLLIIFIMAGRLIYN